VHRAASVLRRWPRTSAAFGFGAAGTAFSILWWSPVIFQAPEVLPFVLFIGTPGISAAVAGWIFGKLLLDPARVSRSRSAALCGAFIASFALLLFAPLFATLYVWTQPAFEHWTVVSLAFFILIGSALIAWFKVALTGAAIGWALYRVASCDAERASV
jgi:hypothetical protein